MKHDDHQANFNTLQNEQSNQSVELARLIRDTAAVQERIARLEGRVNAQGTMLRNVSDSVRGLATLTRRVDIENLWNRSELKKFISGIIRFVSPLFKSVHKNLLLGMFWGSKEKHLSRKCIQTCYAMTTQQSVYLKLRRTVHELLILWLSHAFLIWFRNAFFLASNISERLPINGKRKVNFSHYSLSAILLDKNKKVASEVEHFSPFKDNFREDRLLF